MKTKKIYLIQGVDSNETIYKIGYTTKSAQERIKQLQTGSGGLQLEVIFEFETKFGTKLESTLHRLFDYKRIQNEWYKLDLEDVVNFKAICERYENNFKLLENENYHFNKWLKK